MVGDFRRHDGLPPTRQQERLERCPRDDPTVQEDERPGNDAENRVGRATAVS